MNHGDSIQWEWRTIEFDAGWSSRALVQAPYSDGDRPILGIASAVCSWEASGEHEEFIARACNSHGDLLEACRFAIEAIGRQSKFWKDDPILARVTIDLEAAIAKAEGRTP